MKKGWTLIELIISVSIILIVGISTTLFLFKNKNDKELEQITKQILESANTYINVESDKEGNTFLKQINAGRAGVQIPLTKLIEKGYIEGNLVKTLKKEKGNDVIEKNYVLALLGDGTEGNECDGISLKISWDINTNDEVYLCKKNTSITPSAEENYLIYLVPDNCELSKGYEIVNVPIGAKHKIVDLNCPKQFSAYFMGWRTFSDSHLEDTFNPEVAYELEDFYTGMLEGQRNSILEPGTEITIDKITFLKPVYYMPYHEVVPGVLYENTYPYNATNNNVSFANKLWKALDSNTMILNEHIGKANSTSQITNILNEWYDENLKVYEKNCNVKKNTLRLLTTQEFDNASDGTNAKGIYHYETASYYGKISFLKVSYSYWVYDKNNNKYKIVENYSEGLGGTDAQGVWTNLIHYDNVLRDNRINDTYVRPVISIPQCKDTLHIPGDGTESNPYIISKPDYLK